MKLYLVQHGKACDKEVDPERPLTDRGRADIERLAQCLKQANVKADRIIHSGKLRAVQTAEVLAHVIAPGLDLESSNSINPNDDPAAFQWQQDNANNEKNTNIVLVGHLPFMGKLVSHLLVADAGKDIVAYRPGTVVCLERVDNAWRLNWMIRPGLVT